MIGAGIVGERGAASLDKDPGAMVLDEVPGKHGGSIDQVHPDPAARRHGALLQVTYDVSTKGLVARDQTVSDVMVPPTLVEKVIWLPSGGQEGPMMLVALVVVRLAASTALPGLHTNPGT